jgi:biotin carboxylase
MASDRTPYREQGDTVFADDEDVPVRTAVIVIPSGTYRAGAFVEAARSLDLDVIVASDASTTLPDDRYLRVDLTNPRAAATAIAELGRPIDAVIAVDDRSVMAAAIAAELLGVRHNPPPAVAATLNKAMLRRALEARNVPQPAFELATPSTDIVALTEYVGTPVVLKPLSLSGGAGVIRIDHPLQSPAAEERIRRVLAVAGRNPNEPILVERYQPGVEVAVEGLMTDGNLTVLATLDKPEQTDGPYFEETMLVTPSSLHPEVLEEVEAVTARAVYAIGLREGPVHAELRVDGPSVAIIEVAARSIGGLCSRSLHFGLLGTTLESLLLRHAVGLPVDPQREEIASGVYMLPVPVSGRFQGIEGLAAARGVRGISEVVVTVPRGARVASLPDVSRYLGFLFANGSSPDSVAASLRTARDALEILIDEPAQ